MLLIYIIYILSIAINNVRMMRLIDIIHNYSLLFFFPIKINTVTAGDPLYTIVGNDEYDLCISLV